MDCECLANARNMTIFSTVVANMLAKGLTSFELNILSTLLTSIGSQLDLIAAYDCTSASDEETALSQQTN